MPSLASRCIYRKSLAGTCRCGWLSEVGAPSTGRKGTGTLYEYGWRLPSSPLLMATAWPADYGTCPSHGLVRFQVRAIIRVRAA
eukprot:scaffold142222_cov31-Prasinocladus_malaysianus.AAC.1